MVLKIKKKDSLEEKFLYKSSKAVVTPQEIELANEFDQQLNKTIKKIERVLLKEKVLTRTNKKKDPLRAWFIIGEYINKFLEQNNLEVTDEPIFWDSLYGRSDLITKTVPKSRISYTRNDFNIAAILARRYSFEEAKRIGSWAVWREILSYKTFMKDGDGRMLDWVVHYLMQHAMTRDEARQFLKAVSARFKRIEISILNRRELQEKLNNFVLKEFKI